MIEEEVKKMGGFEAALAEKNRNEGIGIGREQGIGIGREQGIGIGREQRDREIIARMLRRGKLPEEIADLCEVSLEQVKQVKSDLLSLA